jgi:hypothetical protein
MQALAAVFGEPGQPADSALALGALAWSMLHDYPQNMPLPGGARRGFEQPANASSESPLLTALLDLLPILPVFASSLTAGTQAVDGKLEITPAGTLRLTITLRKA